MYLVVEDVAGRGQAADVIATAVADLLVGYAGRQKVGRQEDGQGWRRTRPQRERGDSGVRGDLAGREGITMVHNQKKGLGNLLTQFITHIHGSRFPRAASGLDVSH